MVRAPARPRTGTGLPDLGLCRPVPVIVDVLLAEQDTSLTGLSYDEVAAGVRAYVSERLPPASVDALLDPQVLHLDARLDRLTQWQVVVR